MQYQKLLGKIKMIKLSYDKIIKNEHLTFKLI